MHNRLNAYLNAICLYMEKTNPFLLENLDSICRLNDSFLSFIKKFSFDNKVIQNRLTFEDVFNLAREIIVRIDSAYLKSFDHLIQSGELDFDYEGNLRDSECIHMIKNHSFQQLINISRQFNYNDVLILIHEFIHYTNGTTNSLNRNYFTEFLSIYFEFYSIDYLLKKGINKDEMDCLRRFKSAKYHSSFLFRYEIVLLAYISFGNLADDTVSLLQTYFLNISKKNFEQECTWLYESLSSIEQENQEILQKKPGMLGCILSEDFIAYNYKYLLGTFLAIYAHRYSDFHDIVNFNHYIHEFDDKTVFDICLHLGIDLKSKDFSQKLFWAIEGKIPSLKRVHS